jgi:NTE family protein
MFRLFDRPTPLALALQGGGAHGAFTWGVLDRLLEDGRFPIAAISGTSAGAINAVALASGLLDGGNEGARAALQRVWQSVGKRVPYEMFVVGSADRPGLAPAARAWMQWTRLLAPHHLNPLGLNPLRDVLIKHIDFERLRVESRLRLYIAATHANSGRLRLFGNAELSVDAVLASACLPTLQPAVVIDGEPYWDGGYSANPALYPLVRSGVADLLIVWLSPLVYARSPVSAEEIRERALDFAFNATFLREAQMLADLCAGARRSSWPFGTLARLRTHLIDAHDALSQLAQETKLMAHAPFLESLRERGRERAEAWLESASHRVGKTSTVDLAAMFASPGA